jgi:glutamate formiminotransferase / 5-formyltetrahydrofolate cyclo-ligase
VSLLGVPNVSEGRDPKRIAELEAAFARGVAVLDCHSDADHNRSVFTISGVPGALVEPLSRGAEAAIELLDMSGWEGLHPCVGALDVCPIVWLDPADHEPARAEALSIAERIGGLGVPVFLYGELASRHERAERAYFREGGLTELSARMRGGMLRPDYGPQLPHPSAGATLVTARPPLAAFNVELDTGDAEAARRIAASLRESGGGLPGVRAIGLRLSSGRAQVSTNVHDPGAIPLGTVVERIRELAEPLGARPVEAELIGLVPERALAGYPDGVPIRGFDPGLHVIERRLPGAP